MTKASGLANGIRGFCGTVFVDKVVQIDRTSLFSTTLLASGSPQFILTTNRRSKFIVSAATLLFIEPETTLLWLLAT
jgi:hypothetical protein